MTADASDEKDFALLREVFMPPPRAEDVERQFPPPPGPPPPDAAAAGPLRVCATPRQRGGWPT
jgi:hypothetical protein